MQLQRIRDVQADVKLEVAAYLRLEQQRCDAARHNFAPEKTSACHRPPLPKGVRGRAAEEPAVRGSWPYRRQVGDASALLAPRPSRRDDRPAASAPAHRSPVMVRAGSRAQSAAHYRRADPEERRPAREVNADVALLRLLDAQERKLRGSISLPNFLPSTRNEPGHARGERPHSPPAPRQQRKSSSRQPLTQRGAWARRRQVLELYVIHQRALAKRNTFFVSGHAAFHNFEEVLALHYPKLSRAQHLDLLATVREHEDGLARRARRHEAVARRAEIAQVFGLIDNDSSGSIDFGEMLQAALRAGFDPSQAEELRSNFEARGGEIGIDEFTELLAEREDLNACMEGLLAEGRKKRERQERIRNPIKVSASQNRRAGRSTNARPSLADMRLDQQRSELLEAKRKQPLPSP